MCAEYRVDDMSEEGNHPIRKIFQCPIRNTVRVRSLANLETNDGFVNLVRGA
jgi:hypothetical protein